MSSELERLLREARKSLPEPEAASTEQGRLRALAAIRRRRPRVRVAALVAVAVAVALGLGVGLGSLIAPSGTAAQAPIGFGFLPEPGWFALQSAVPASPDQPAVAVAANVPYAPDDDIRGLADPSGLPYSTLLELPPEGVVIVASLLAHGDEQRYGAEYPEHDLPLRMRDAVPYQYGTQLRPEQPLGHYQLRGSVGDYDIDLHIYVGTTRPSADLLASAQRQLDKLLVEPDSSSSGSARTGRAATASPAVIDRTFVCSTALVGGVYEIEASARSGSRAGRIPQDKLALVSLTTGSIGSAASALNNAVVWMTAGRPSRASTVIPDPFVGFTYPIRTWGTLAVNGDLCKASRARVGLTSTGLTSRVVPDLDVRFECAAPRRVVIRVRAALRSRASIRRYRQFSRTNVAVRQGQLAVRTLAGRPLVYAEVFESGRARLYTARTCNPD